MSSGGIRPMNPVKIQMDVSLAMAILGFSSSQGFENTSTDDIQAAFMKKMHGQDKFKFKTRRSKLNRKDEQRRVNEAFQFLLRKRRKLTGRAMAANWHIMGGKSNKALDIISSLRFGASSKKNLLGDKKKLEELEQKKLQDVESERAKALADKLISDAGLNAQLLTLISQSKEQNWISKNFTTVPQPETSTMSADRPYNNFMFEEKRRKPSAFPKDSSFNSHSNARKMSLAPKKEYKFGKNYVSHYKKPKNPENPKRHKRTTPIIEQSFVNKDDDVSVEVENQETPLQLSLPVDDEQVVEDPPVHEDLIVELNKTLVPKNIFGSSFKGKMLSKLALKDKKSTAPDSVAIAV